MGNSSIGIISSGPGSWSGTGPYDESGRPAFPTPPPPAAKPKLKYASFYGFVVQFFQDQPNCVTEFQKLGIYESFLRTSRNALYVDFTDPQNAQFAYLTFREVGLKSRDLGDSFIFVVLGGVPGVAWIKEQTVTIGEAFYTAFGRGYSERLITVIHENLHLHFRALHVGVAEKLGLGALQ